MSRCLWCGDPWLGEGFCDLCMASGANPNNDRYKPHSVHTGQFFEVDFDLFCQRMNIQEAPFEPDPEAVEEAVKSMAAAVDRIVLSRVHELQAKANRRDRESDGSGDRGMSEPDSGE